MILINVFLQMVSSSKKTNVAWPELKSNKTTPVQRLINVTGAKAVPRTTLRAKKESESEPECEDYMPAPQFNRSFMDGIENVPFDTNECMSFY